MKKGNEVLDSHDRRESVGAPEIEITSEMEEAGGWIIQNHTGYSLDRAMDVAREVLAAMIDKSRKSAC